MSFHQPLAIDSLVAAFLIASMKQACQARSTKRAPMLLAKENGCEKRIDLLHPQKVKERVDIDALHIQLARLL